eukprot:COSAG01_NODE_5894_length_3965_cov_2.764615_4_plen_66_part_00
MWPKMIIRCFHSTVWNGRNSHMSYAADAEIAWAQMNVGQFELRHYDCCVHTYIHHSIGFYMCTYM